MSKFETDLNIQNILLAPDRPADDKLSLMLQHALQAHTVSRPQTSDIDILWPAGRFGLQRSSLYQSLSPLQQQAILQKLTKLNLSLSYWIEKSGHQYGAKMILLSDTLQEKSLYALFAAEEAIHLQEFLHFMNFKPQWGEHAHPMLIPLANAIAGGEKSALVFIIQVLLEGFGMSHYSGLMQSCLHPQLREAYARILKDEARHHGAGLLLTNESVPTKLAREQIFEYAREFITALQSANWIKKALEDVAGEMSSSAENRFWSELDYQKELGQRRLKLREMIEKVDRYGLAESLVADGVL